MIKITRIAREMLARSCKTSKHKYIEFGVKGGGCSGFKYYLKPSNETHKFDELIKLNKESTLKIENMSQLHLVGTEIDWKNDIMGNYFVFNNPNSNIKCGCGESFG